MKRRLFSMLLALAMALSLSGGARAAQRYVEAASAEGLAMAISDSSEDYARVLVQTDALADTRGAARVVHYAPLGIYVLEYNGAAQAQSAQAALAARYGADCCWLDTPETAAVLLDQAPADADETPPPADHTFRSWGAGAMELTRFRNDDMLRAHYEGRTLTVAVLDTGADPETLAARCRTLSPDSYDFVNATAAMSDVSTGDAAGHGTMVTTLLDDLLPEEAEILLLRVFNDTGSASRAVILSALSYALEHGADVINMSLGWEGADSSFHFLDTVLERAWAQNVPVVCAAGNKSTNASTCYPASCRTTLSVSAVSQALRYELFSNFGSSVDFCAPGSGIRTVGPQNTDMISRGTSFAAPHVAAAAADMLLLRPMNSNDLYAAMKACSADLGLEGRDELYGWGLPQLDAFVQTHLTHQWDAGHTAPLATWDTAGERISTCVICGETKTETIPATAGNVHNPFVDVSAAIYYAAPVTWAIANHITAGVSADGTRFAPDNPCTRAQMVTFLWRAAGSPAPETAASPFADVRDDTQYYYDAVLWAVEQGITIGTSENTFSPEDTVTRAQTVTFLWRMAGKPTALVVSPFTDVAEEEYYYAPVLWAVSREITRGVDNEHFAPEEPCTRAQIVTLLYRYLGV